MAGERTKWILFSAVLLALTLSAVANKSEGNKQKRATETEPEKLQRFQVVAWNFPHVETPYIISLWIVLASVAKIGFHLYNKLSSIFPESCLLIVLGIVVGIILYFSKANSEQYVLSTTTFFLFLLPPIILDAGYFMPNRAFFDNLGTILVFAVIGTLFNTLLIGASLYGVSLLGWIGVEISLLQCLVFSSLISAVDPVAVLAVFEEIHINEVLYIIVFGESLLNDAVTVVLYHMMESYTEIGEENIQTIDIVAGIGSFFVVGLGGVLIGVIFGLVTGFITKYTDHVRVIEPLFVFIVAYLSYLSAEMLELSGILAITFCGMSMKQYVEANISQKSHTTIKYFMKMLTNVSETIIFMFLGLSTVVDTHVWNVGFILFSLLFCLVYRAAGIVIFTWVVNHMRMVKLTKVDQFVMSYGGLRGAIAFCLVLLLDEKIIPQKRMMVTTTIVIVYFTVFVQGITIKPLVNLLKVKKASKHKPSMNEMIHDRLIDHLMVGIEDVIGHHGHHTFRDKCEFYNTKFLKPILLRDKPKTRETEIFEVFTKLNLKDAMDYLATHGSFVPSDMAREHSLAKIIRNHSENKLNDLSPDDEEGMHKTSTVLDMQAVEAHYSKKIADDSKCHHILEDNMYRTRRTSVKVSKYTLPDTQNQTPFRHAARRQLRMMISQSRRPRSHKSSNAGKSTHSSKNHLDPNRPVKNVSFSTMKSVSFADIPDGVNNSDATAPIPKRDSDDESDVGIMFTVSPPAADIQISPGMVIEETAAEKILPWKRQASGDPVTSDDCRMLPNDDSPQMSSRPSWVNNPGYNHLNESGSGPSVADNSNEASRTENPDEIQNNVELPVPWAKEEMEEPLKSPNQNVISDKMESLVHSVHRCAPPSHHVIIPVGNSIAEEMEENEYLDEYAEGTGSNSNSKSAPNLQKQVSIDAHRPPYVRHHSASLMQDLVEESNTRKRIHDWLNTSETDVQISAAEGTTELSAKYSVNREHVANKDSDGILNLSSNSIEESYL